MSSDSAQWPVVAPGFMYIVKMGDFTHILQPADQKSSEHLNLAQVAIRDINVARRLLNERGPFLLLDKQEKMDQMITETETAINRVIKILEPARVEHISEQSIRFNTRDPWALRDEPKSAATFGRLQITHDALKTVVHDLNNIEATAQLDDCGSRVNPAPDTANSHSPATPVNPTSQPKDARHLITWKRERSRRANRNAQNNTTLPGGGPAVNDRNTNDVFSPVSPEERFTNMPIGEPSGRSHRDSISTPDSLLHSESAHDHVSDVSADRLPVIHELEGGAIVQLGRVPVPGSALDDTTGTERNTTDMGTPKPLAEPNSTKNAATSDKQSNQVSSNNRNRAPSSPPVLRVTPPTLKQNNRVKRETFEELRQRNGEAKQPSNNISSSVPNHNAGNVPSDVPSNVSSNAPSNVPGNVLSRFPNNIASNGQQQSTNVQQREPLQHRQAPDSSTQQALGRFASLKARWPANRHSSETKQSNNGVAGERASHTQNAQSLSKLPTSVAEEADATSGYMKQRQMRRRQDNAEECEAPVRSVTYVKSATYPPVQTQLQPPSKPDGAAIVGQGPSNQILSPSRAQLSPLEQVQPSDASEPAATAPLQPHERDHQIFAIDPELTRLPSLLRPARPRRDGGSRNASPGKTDKANELHLSENTLPVPLKNPLDRSVTAPPVTHIGTEGSHGLSQDMPKRDDIAHLRSMSDTAVPQHSVGRAPTVPRKPLPYQNSPLPSRDTSPHVVSRIATPVLQRPHSEVISQLNVPQSTRGTSGPPSPVHSDHPRNLAPQRPRAASAHSLSVQAPSSVASSIKSGISADGTNGHVPSPGRPPKANGLAMNPPEIPDRQTSAYQAQKMAQANQQAQVLVQTPDYRSPAWQQSRQYFDPGLVNFGQPVAPYTGNTSRFRDQDQIRARPVDPKLSNTTSVPAPNSLGPASEANRPGRLSEQTQPSIQPQQPVQPPQPVPQQQNQQLSQPPVQSPTQPPLQPPQTSNPQTRLKKTPGPQSPEQAKPSFLQHQAARLHARQQIHPAPALGPAPMPQQVTQLRPEQALPLRVNLTPRQPADMSRPTQAGDPNYAARAVPPQVANQGPPPTQNAAGKQPEKSVVRDKDLFAQQVFRPNSDKQLAPPKEQSAPPTEQPTLIAEESQSQQRPQPQPKQNQPEHSHDTAPTHECHCDDDAPKSSESLRELIKMNNRLAQNVPTIPARSEHRVPPAQATQAAQATPAVPAGSTAPKQQKKKKSWLVHQAGKIAGKTAS